MTVVIVARDFGNKFSDIFGVIVVNKSLEEVISKDFSKYDKRLREEIRSYQIMQEIRKGDQIKEKILTYLFMSS